MITHLAVEHGVVGEITSVEHATTANAQVRRKRLGVCLNLGDDELVGDDLVAVGVDLDVRAVLAAPTYARGVPERALGYRLEVQGEVRSGARVHGGGVDGEVHLLKKAILDVSGNGFHITIGLSNESTREKKKKPSEIPS